MFGENTLTIEMMIGTGRISLKSIVIFTCILCSVTVLGTIVIDEKNLSNEEKHKFGHKINFLFVIQ